MLDSRTIIRTTKLIRITCKAYLIEWLDIQHIIFSNKVYKRVTKWVSLMSTKRKCQCSREIKDCSME